MRLRDVADVPLQENPFALAKKSASRPNSGKKK
jgi:hypothetical protein